MTSLIAESGPVLWITAPLGIAAVFSALWFAATGAPRTRSLAIGLALTSVTAGAFGTVSGIRLVLGGILSLAEEDRWILVQGIRESLTCLTAGLGLAVVVGLVLSVGSLRFPPSSRSHARSPAESTATA